MDACGGHPAPGGVYHDHLTGTFPDTLGCFRGAVDPALPRRGPGG